MDTIDKNESEKEEDSDHDRIKTVESQLELSSHLWRKYLETAKRCSSMESRKMADEMATVAIHFAFAATKSMLSHQEYTSDKIQERLDIEAKFQKLEERVESLKALLSPNV